MNSIPLTGQSVLNEATPRQLETAVAENHRELFSLNAVCQGGDVHTIAGLTYTYEGSLNGGGMIAFPLLAENNAGELLDGMMAYYRAHAAKNIGCWSLDPPQTADLGIKLLARGFQPGWWPGWMALDLGAIKTDHGKPRELQIRTDNDTSTHHLKSLPYSGDDGAVSNALMHAHPDRVQRFIAILNGEIVAQSCVLFTCVAGLYNVGVVPGARNKGIGKAVVLAACLYAKERGYRYAVLNATGRRMYEQVGFKFISNGRTWWLMDERYISHPPSQTDVAMAEATGKGDIIEMDRLNKYFTSDDLSTPITNGMTLIQLAVHCRQPGAVEWLLAHGAKCNVIDAWDLGWKEKAAELLANDPHEADRQYNDRQITLLHIAAERNDIALAKLALSAKPNLELKDKIYNGTALGWAQYLKRVEIERLIKEYTTLNPRVL